MYLYINVEKIFVGLNVKAHTCFRTKLDVHIWLIYNVMYCDMCDVRWKIQLLNKGSINDMAENRATNSYIGIVTETTGFMERNRRI